MVPNGRVIVVTFAGRQDRMSILCEYITEAVRQGCVDEYHVWNFARDPKDEVWFKEWIQSHSSFARLYEPKERKNWGECYRHYVKEAAQYSKDVFIKLDDDIVYLSLATFREWIDFRRAPENRDYWIVSANVVNNEMCAFYQQKHGLLPHPPFAKLPYIPHGYGPLWKTGSWPLQLHEAFLNKPKNHFNLPQNIIEPRQERISINAISWMGADWPNMHPLGTTTDDDELYMSVTLPLKYKRSNIIFAKFIASHLSFAEQEKDFKFKTAIPALLDRYRTVCQESIHQIRLDKASSASLKGESAVIHAIPIATAADGGVAAAAAAPAAAAPAAAAASATTTSSPSTSNSTNSAAAVLSDTQHMPKESGVLSSTKASMNDSKSSDVSAASSCIVVQAIVSPYNLGWIKPFLVQILEGTEKTVWKWTTQSAGVSPDIFITQDWNQLLEWRRNWVPSQPSALRPFFIFIQDQLQPSIVGHQQKYTQLLNPKLLFPIDLWIDIQCHPCFKIPAVPTLFVPPILRRTITSAVAAVSQGKDTPLSSSMTEPAEWTTTTQPNWWEPPQPATDRLWMVHSLGGPYDKSEIKQWSHPLFLPSQLKPWQDLLRQSNSWSGISEQWKDANPAERWREYQNRSIADLAVVPLALRWCQSELFDRAWTILKAAKTEEYAVVALRTLIASSMDQKQDSLLSLESIRRLRNELSIVFARDTYSGSLGVGAILCVPASTAVLPAITATPPPPFHFDFVVYSSDLSHLNTHKTMLQGTVWSAVEAEYWQALSIQTNPKELDHFLTTYAPHMDHSNPLSLSFVEEWATHRLLWGQQINQLTRSISLIATTHIVWNPTVLSWFANHLQDVLTRLNIKHWDFIWFEPTEKKTSRTCCALTFEAIEMIALREPWTYDVPLGKQYQVPKTKVPPTSAPLPSGPYLYPYLINSQGAQRCLKHWDSGLAPVKGCLFQWIQHQQTFLQTFVCRIPNLFSFQK
jgi:hypothetical protein